MRSPLRIARELRHRIPPATLAVIAGAGHSCNAEAPYEYNANVRRFLRDQAHGGGVRGSQSS